MRRSKRERGVEPWQKADISKEGVRSSQTCVPAGAVLTCAVESGTITAPGAHNISALASTSYSRSIIRDNTLNSLSQSERFMSRSDSNILAAATLTRFSPSGCDGVSLCRPTKRLTQTHNSSMSDIYSLRLLLKVSKGCLACRSA